MRKSLIKRWKRATSEDERNGLAEELLAAMSHEDAVRQPIEPRYESWEERRRREESIACMPFTMCAWPGRVPCHINPSQSRADMGLPNEVLVSRDGYLGEDKDIVAAPEIGENEEVEEKGPCFVVPGNLMEMSGDIRCVICLEWRPASDFNSDQRRRFGNVSRCNYCLSARDCDLCSLFKHAKYFSKSPCRNNNRQPWCLDCMDWRERVDENARRGLPPPPRLGEVLQGEDAAMQKRFREILAQFVGSDEDED